MTKTWNWITTHVTHIAITWIAVGFILLIIYIAIYKAANWQVLSGFATWVLAGGVFLAFSQIREAKRSTNAQLAVEFFQRLKCEKDTLRRIYKLGPEDIKRISKNSNWGVDNLNKNKIDSVLDMFNMIGGLRKQGILDKSLAIGIIAGAPALRCWYKLNGYIKEERSKRGYVLEYYEDFTRECLDYFDKEQVKIKLYKEGPREKPKDLMCYFAKLKKEGDKRYPRCLKKIKKDRETDKQG